MENIVRQNTSTSTDDNTAVGICLLLVTILVFTLLSGCSSLTPKVTQNPEAETNAAAADSANKTPSEIAGKAFSQSQIPHPKLYPEDPDIVQYITERKNNYIYQGHQFFEREELGYSLKFIHEFEPERKADVYIFNVPQELEHLSRNELIFGFTGHALDEILQAEEQGYYQDVVVLEKTAWRFLDGIISEVAVSMTVQGHEKISLIYMAEHHGTLLKARITMADMASNHQHKTMDFVSRLFSEIIIGMDAQQDGLAVLQKSEKNL